MSNDWSLSQLKQSYRSRYHGNRLQDVPDWKPGDNAVSFVNKYLHLTTPNSDFDSIVNRSSLSIHVTTHQSREKKGQDASTSCGNYTPGQSKDVHLKTKKDLPRNPSISEMNENTYFSDEDSDNGHPYMIAKLIEESLTENIDVLGNSEKCIEKLYRSDTSVLKEPPSPTSKIHAKKCLSFRDVAPVASKSHKTDRGSRKFSHNVEQLELQEQEPLNLNNENPNPTHTTSNLRPKTMFIMEEERGSSSSSWVSPFKKKTVSLFSTPVEAKQTAIPKKANSIKVTNIQQKSPENKKSSAKRPKNMLIMEEERGSNSSSWVSPFKKKTVSLFSTPVEAKQTATPKKANPIKVTNIQQKSSESKKSSAERPNNMLIMEEERGSSSSSWVSPFKKKTVSFFSTPVEAKRTATPKKSNPIKVTNIQQKSPENKKSSAERTVSAERMVKDLNSRKMSFLDTFFKSSAFGYVGNRSPVVYEHPPISSATSTDEEFNLEGMSSNNKPFLITVPGKAQPSHNSSVKGEKTALQMTNSESQGSVKKRSKRKQPMSSKKAVQASVQETAVSQTEEVVESGPVAKLTAVQPVIKQLKKPLALSQDADLPHLVEEEENGHQDLLLVENQEDHDSQHAEKTLINPMLKKVQQTRRILRQRGNKRAVTAFNVLDTKFNIRSRKEKGKTNLTKSAKKTKKSKSSEKKLEHQVKEKKTKKIDLKKRNVHIQSQYGRLEIDNRDKKTAETKKELHPRKREAKVKHVGTPCPAEHNSEESDFQSGLVIRQRALQVTAAVKPIACDLDSLESDGQDHVPSEVENDSAIMSDSEGQEQQISSEDHEPIDSRNLKELFSRHSIVFDPDTQSDVLVECVSQGEKSTFVGDDACTSWNSFNNSIFNTGKLIIAPNKFTKRCISTSIVIYYIEQGQVQLNLHKSERILKAGDFFFVPPGNRSKIINLQDMEAVLVFNKLNMFS